MANENKDVLRIVDTLANVQANMRNKQIAFETTNSRIVVKDAGGSLHYFAKAGTVDDTDILISDNTTDAFRVRQDVNEYVNISTVDSTEIMSFGNTSINPEFRYLGTGKFGIGVTPAQKFEIGSNDNSDRISIYHDNTDAYIKTSDGSIIVMTDEGTDTDTKLQIKGKETGRGFLEFYDQNDSEYLQMYVHNGVARILTAGISPSVLDFQYTAQAGARFYNSCSEGETQTVDIAGHKTSGTKATAKLGVGVHTDQVLSIYNAQGYYFDNTVRFVDGTVGAPSIAFHSEIDTGFWRPGTNCVACSVNGSEVWRVDANGDLGVGESSPGFRLVSKDTNAGGILACLLCQNNSTTAGSEAGIVFATTTATVTTASSVPAWIGTSRSDNFFRIKTGPAALASLTTAIIVDTSQRMGIGVTPAQKFEIGSTDNSDRISIYHDNSHAYFDTDDGYIFLRTVESGAHLTVALRGDGAGGSSFRIYDANNTNYVNMQAIAGRLELKTVGASNSDIYIQEPGDANIYLFGPDGAEGNTPFLGITGWKTGGTKDQMQFAVGVHADQVGSIYGCANGYYIDHNLGIKVTSPQKTLDVAGTIQFDLTASDADAMTIKVGGTTYYYGDTSNQIHRFYQGMAIFGSSLDINTGYANAATARSNQVSIKGKSFIYVNAQTGADYFAFADKWTDQTLWIYNDGATTAYIDDDETQGISICAGAHALCMWRPVDDKWYQIGG